VRAAAGGARKTLQTVLFRAPVEGTTDEMCLGIVVVTRPWRFVAP
jgi:hypothetical protein